MNRHIKVYLDEAEYNQLKSIVSAEGTTISSYARKIIREAMAKSVKWDEFHPYPSDIDIVWLIPRKDGEVIL